MATELTTWWDDSLTKGTEQVRSRLLVAARLAWSEEAHRRERLENYARIYLNRNIGGLQPDAFEDFSPTKRQKIRVQITRTMIDAIMARIGKNKPKPTALTQRGDFGMQSQAKRQDQFLWGIFQREKAYHLGRRALRDSLVFADGLTKVFSTTLSENGKLNGRVRFERVPPWEVFVDRYEGYYGAPRNKYQIHTIDRGVLIGMFPKKKAKILAHDHQWIVDYHITETGRGVLNDRLQVLESWHLPSAPDAHDGRHILTLHGMILQDREWKHDRFPFAHLRWADMLPAGYWSQSLVETSEPVQRELNELYSKAQVAHYYNSRPVILVEDGSDVDEGSITNDVRGIVIKYRGVEPKFHAPQVLPNEFYNHMERLFTLAMSLEGVSELSVASKKPTGLDSGRALLVHNDIESERFALRGIAYEDYYLELGHLALMTARDLHEAGIPIEVSTVVKRRRRRYVDKIKWGEVAIDTDNFELSLMPSSSLPNTPAGRRQAVESMFEIGFIDRQAALELMELPDTDAMMSRELAPFELPLYQMEELLEGKQVSPIPQQDLVQAMKIAQQVFQRAIIDELPEDRLDLLNQYMEMVKDLMKSAAEEAQRQEMEAMQMQQAAVAPPQQAGPPMDPAAQVGPPMDPAAQMGGALPPEAQPALPPAE